MVKPDFTIKQGDTSPSIKAQLVDSGDAIDLHNVVVGFRMVHQQDDVKIRGLCSIEDRDNGQVSYIWRNGDTDVVGKYDAEFILDFDIPENIDEFDIDETFPSDEFLTVKVTETLDF